LDGIDVDVDVDVGISRPTWQHCELAVILSAPVTGDITYLIMASDPIDDNGSVPIGAGSMVVWLEGG
jgi:hypothetical protein